MTRWQKATWILWLTLTGCGVTPASEGLFTGPPSQRLAGHASTHFAIVGDFGVNKKPERAVAKLIDGWDPQFVITLGDNNYPEGAAETLDENVGQYYHRFIHPYRGTYGAGAEHNRFFPALGNHDWNTGDAAAHLAYFSLPNNGRYYAVRQGPVHLFCLDSDPREPDGIDVDSQQAAWLQRELGASDARWRVVYMHHAPYSSAKRQGAETLRWPFARWGADLVLSGHHHLYERLEHDGIFYVVNGLGGARRGKFGEVIDAGSLVRYSDRHGAMMAVATREHLALRFVTRDGDEEDSFELP